MNLYALKTKIKNTVIGDIYDGIYGKRKANKEEEQKIQALKKYGISNLAKITKELNEVKAPYFLNFGSLLGVIRDGKFMDYDDDIDFGVFINDEFTWDDLEKILKKCGFKKNRQFKFDGKIEEQTYESDGLLVDFFGFWRGAEFNHVYCFYHYKDYMYNSANEFHAVKYNYCKFESEELRDFNGVQVKVPRSPEEYLASVYSDDWREPDPNWNRYKNPDSWVEIDDRFALLETF